MRSCYLPSSLHVDFVAVVQVTRKERRFASPRQTCRELRRRNLSIEEKRQAEPSLYLLSVGWFDRLLPSSSVRFLGCFWLLAWPRADPYRLNEVWQRRLAEACLEKRVSLKAGNEAVRTGVFYSWDSRYMLSLLDEEGGGAIILRKSSISMDDDPWDGVEEKIPRLILIPFFSRC